jgi:hypothetical protein
VGSLNTLGFALGSAWLSGINLYATVLTLGLLQRFGLAHLPGDLSVLSHTWVLAAAGVMYAIEFIADKIPLVDSAWDAVHTFIRIPAGAVLAAAAFWNFDPSVRIAATLAGGGIALGSHGTKTAVRAVANTSPEPFSNIGLSLLEDVVAVGLSTLMTLHPVLVLAVVTIFTVVVLVLARKMIRAIRRRFSRSAAA